MTTLDMLTQALRDCATDATKASMDPKNSHAVKEAFWFQARFCENLERKLQTVARDNPTPTDHP